MGEIDAAFDLVTGGGRPHSRLPAAPGEKGVWQQSPRASRSLLPEEGVSDAAITGRE
jgi:hypothetical protein